MARSHKQGLDYFPHDVSFDDEFKYLLALHKEFGYYVYFRLLEKIYSGHGYYMDASKRTLGIFSTEINVDINRLNDVINDCLREHLFDKCMHENNKILTSNGIQKRFFEAIKRRKEVCLKNAYILVDNVDIMLHNVNIIWLNDDDNKQSKVKESKVKESKVKESKEAIPFSDIISRLNKIANTNYKTKTKDTQNFIKARFNDGYSLEDFYVVLENMKPWLTDPKMIEYYRPQTLFGTKFSAYLNKKTVENQNMYSDITRQNIETGRQWLERDEDE